MGFGRRSVYLAALRRTRSEAPQVAIYGGSEMLRGLPRFPHCVLGRTYRRVRENFCHNNR